MKREGSRLVIYHPDLNQPTGVLQDARDDARLTPGAAVEAARAVHNTSGMYELEVEGRTIHAWREPATGDDTHVRIYYVPQKDTLNHD